MQSVIAESALSVDALTHLMQEPSAMLAPSLGPHLDLSEQLGEVDKIGW